jgi:outer membrane protein assembly factor BamD (BamD/ComL family)
MNRTGDMIIGIVGLVVFLVVFIWLAIRTIRNSEDPAKLIVKWIVTAGLVGFGFPFSLRFGPYSPLIMIIFAVPVGIIWAPHLGEFVASPLTGMFDGGREQVDPTPLYSIAEGKRQRGDYTGAVAELRKQLEKFPGDFRATMLIASIQAEDQHDLPSAQLTVERLLEFPNHAVQHVTSALHTMADWSLKYAMDVAAAREYLERIVLLFPDSPQAHMAAQRIASLAGDRHAGSDAVSKTFEVKRHEGYLGLVSSPKRVAQEMAASSETAGDLVKQLEAHPWDTGARERLAIIYAEEFQRMDLAADQLEQLIAIPAETPKNIARWLNLLATLHIKIARDRQAAEDALRRIIDKMPKSALADVARQRLAYIEAELKSKDIAETKKLGTYERNLGLKKSTTSAE